MTNKLHATFYWKIMYTFSIWNSANGERSTCNGGRYFARLQRRIIHFACFRRNAITVISFLNTYLVLYFMCFLFQQQKVHMRHGLCSCKCFSCNNYDIHIRTYNTFHYNRLCLATWKSFFVLPGSIGFLLSICVQHFATIWANDAHSLLLNSQPYTRRLLGHVKRGRCYFVVVVMCRSMLVVLFVYQLEMAQHLKTC